MSEFLSWDTEKLESSFTENKLTFSEFSLAWLPSRRFLEHSLFSVPRLEEDRGTCSRKSLFGRESHIPDQRLFIESKFVQSMTCEIILYMVYADGFKILERLWEPWNVHVLERCISTCLLPHASSCFVHCILWVIVRLRHPLTRNFSCDLSLKFHFSFFRFLMF